MLTIERIRHPLALRRLRVRRVEEIAPRMRRIVLASDELADLASPGADDHVKLIFPEPGQPLRMPRLGEGRLEPVEGAPIHMRDYTPRALDPAAGELVIDFVVHGEGPASSWAASAAPGVEVGQAGPRGSVVVGGDVAWWLLVGDETALPSIGRRLEELGAGVPVRVIVEVDDAAGEIALPSRADVEVTWLHRDGAEPGTGDALERAVRALELSEGEGYAWVGAEASIARRLRAHLRDERKLPKACAKATGYWRRGVENHHDPAEPA